MRHLTMIALLGGAMALSACAGGGQVSRAVSGAADAEKGTLHEVMLTVAEPAEAVSFFAAEVQEDPADLASNRGLAVSLVRAGRFTEAVGAWQKVVRHGDAGPADEVALADSLVRTSDWARAKATLDRVDPQHETFERYRLEAMIADSLQQWNKADTYYEVASELTTTPASLLNNWGYSKLSRGDAAGAERLFAEALTHDASLFTAKNNLVLARASRRVYDLPAIPMTGEERAQLLHTAGLAAVKRGDESTGRSLLEEAMAAHPRHFAAAQRALDALG
ncbi:hypothetical protein JQC91_00920 [Jannaschia sp. Os4]|uniref:tetratricopeptide repeat protein n=1 Tax=Jannaschia sp. Os4 TaxID=2807617 RepID=UPI0019395A04|nr:hypothetical protein [Jannaschia sp. Os4]MBM2574853.1 hypothetical protein [Jannaschia sp. Os4]